MFWNFFGASNMQIQTKGWVSDMGSECRPAKKTQGLDTSQKAKKIVSLLVPHMGVSLNAGTPNTPQNDHF